MPRLDPESSRGLVTDVCLKRKIRNFVEMTEENKAGFEIYIKEKSVLNLQNKKAYEALSIVPESKKMPKDEAKAREITAWMCKNFFDVRTFGAVMTTEVNSGQVRGPVQLAFAKSIDPIIPLEISITRMAVTTEKEAEAQSGGNRTMGRKHIVPYGLYRVHGFISAKLAEKTGFSETDLAKLWQSLTLMFEHDRAAARGEMAARKLVVFKHADALGSAPAHTLFDRVKVERVNGEKDTPANSFGDYDITIDKAGLEALGVSVEEKF
jgi:CRISPR-associated protein Csd2